ncbi:MAG: hypothetical protein JRH11_28225, partial [Deltaproteobacteria bacterium]|nr:hypothetical protein [Deltaproteobacteria bacterium]
MARPRKRQCGPPEQLVLLQHEVVEGTDRDDVEHHEEEEKPHRRGAEGAGAEQFQDVGHRLLVHGAADEGLTRGEHPGLRDVDLTRGVPGGQATEQDSEEADRPVLVQRPEPARVEGDDDDGAVAVVPRSDQGQTEVRKRGEDAGADARGERVERSLGLRG